MRLQAWWCEACGARGAVETEQRAGVLGVFLAIVDDHCRQGTRACAEANGVDFVRVQNEAWVQPETERSDPS